MTFTLRIDTDNAAFEDDLPGEVSRILEQAIEKVRDGGNDALLYDGNGNHVGEFEFTGAED